MPRAMVGGSAPQAGDPPASWVQLASAADTGEVATALRLSCVELAVRVRQVASAAAGLVVVDGPGGGRNGAFALRPARAVSGAQRVRRVAGPVDRPRGATGPTRP